MTVRRYQVSDEQKLMDLIIREGEEWSCYTDSDAYDKYTLALRNSITYIAEENAAIQGFSRSLDDSGFYIYICDLLVDKAYRGRGIGQKLLEQLCIDYPFQNVYVMSDVDEFYRGKDYRKEGTIFEVTL